MVAWLWLKNTAWPWFKENWMWVILFPIALVIYLTGRSHGEVVVVNDDHESDASKKKIEEVETRAAAEKVKEKAELWEKTKKVIEEHRETVDKLTDEQDKQVDELLQDPEALNAYLLNVGKQARDG